MDGVTADLVLCLADDTDFLKLLQDIFLEWQETGKMNVASRLAVMSTMFKDKGERSDWKMYRPVSVTTILYRIYGGCLEQQLSVVLKYLVGDPQVGYAKGRKIDENINLIVEIVRYLDEDAPEEGGLLLMLDNVKAFDRVQWPLMFATLEAFGIPPEFVAAVRVMYADVSTAVKVNGHLTQPFAVNNGIRRLQIVRLRGNPIDNLPCGTKHVGNSVTGCLSGSSPSTTIHTSLRNTSNQ